MSFLPTREGPKQKQSNRKDRIMLKQFTLIVTLATALPAFAQETMDHTGHMKGDMGPVSMAFMEANARMHETMAIEYTGNADVDFIRSMIPHHQGAVEMAKIILENGKDPEVRKLAEGIIATQEAEIAWMKDWLAKNGG
jgi:uncharacterized protein (DUF305 family)